MLRQPTERGADGRIHQVMTHAEALRQHAIRRAWRRFGIALSNGEYLVLCEHVRSRLDKPDGVTAGGKRCYRVIIRGKTIYAGWHDKHGIIGTFHRGERIVVGHKPG